MRDIFEQLFAGPMGPQELTLFVATRTKASRFAGESNVGGGMEPLWSSDGRELFYRNGKRMLVVPIETEDTLLRAGTPQLLFEGAYVADGVGHPQYGVAPGAERFLMLRREPEPLIRVISNWAEELERLAPPE